VSPERRNPLRHLFKSPRQIAAEVDEEILLHLELRAQELERHGWEPSAAREEARRAFGDLDATRRACVRSDRRREKTMERREHLAETAQDLVHGLRLLRRRPGFALAAVLTLAVGVGSTTAIFSAADCVLLRPLPYAEVERVVTLWETQESSGERKEVASGNFLDWRERQRSFAAIGLAEPSGYDLTGDGPPEPLDAWRVSEGFLEALGARPMLGRGFSREEYQPGGPPALIVSHGLWQRRWAGDPAIVGRAVEVDGEPVPLVGVLPPQIEYPEPKHLWTPKHFRPDELAARGGGYMHAVGRLLPGVTLEQAQADLDRIAAELAAEHPRTNHGAGIRAVPLATQVLGAVRPALLVLLAAVGFLLLIACANVASLLLALGVERQPELAVRAALGAGRARLARQLATESALLAALGGAVGIGVAFLAVRILGGLVPPDLPRAGSIAVDGRVLTFAGAVTLVTALVFGLLPALRFSRTGAATALGGGRRAGAGPRASRLRGALVVAEVALALVLLVGAALLARSFAALLANDPGFQVESRLALQIFLWDRNPTPAARLQRVAELVDRFRALPGVEDVGVVSALPFHPSQIDARGELRIEGEATARGEERQTFTTVASAEYFRLMSIPLVAGRMFEERDRQDTPLVALVNQTLARRFFPGQDPVGRRVTVGVMDRPQSREIVGVVGDVRPTALDSEPRPELFVPFAQTASGSMTFVVRVRGDAAALVPPLRAAVWEVDPDQSVYHSGTLDGLVRRTLLERRFHLTLLGAFSLVALALAAVGVYGLANFSVSQRLREIGVRMALGARPRDVARLVVGEAFRLGLPGVLLGTAAALALTRFMAPMLYGVRPTDARSFIGTAAVMLAVAALGALVPAGRAAAGDPLRALRQD
jgi:putative ABC transport system permease protein